MFYPEFNLEKNPFKYADRGTEKRNIEGGYEIVKISAIDLVKSLIDEGPNSFVIGAKGCGKSTVIDSIDEENVVCISGSEFFRDLYNGIGSHAFHKLDDKEREWVAERFFEDRKGRIPPRRNIEGIMVRGDTWICEDMGCPRRRRCDLMSSAKEEKEIVNAIRRRTPTDKNCPLREWLTIELCRVFSRDDTVFLMDVPDILERKDRRYFEQFLINFVRSTNGQIILMATNEQISKIRPKSEYLMRWYTRLFPPPSNGELKEILRTRVEYEGGVFPFDGDALEYLVTASKGNPRRVIQRASVVLRKMKDEKKSEPTGVEYMIGALAGTEGLSSITVMDAIVAVINELYDERGSEWVTAKEMTELLAEVYDVRIKPQELGHKVKVFPLEKNRGTYRKYRLRRVSLVETG